ncbi:MAG: hypothetical protein ACYDEX_12040 [Mobilitalea sp.]
MSFDKHLRKLKIDESIIEEIMGVDYPKDPTSPKQDNANYMAAVMNKCEELLDYDTVSKVMYDRACCKNGFRLKNSNDFAIENANRSVEEKLQLFGNVLYMGKSFLNEEGDIEIVAVGSYGYDHMICPCWNFDGAKPVNGPMPLSYCKCCGGHFRHHYQKALGLKLRLKEVKSSMINSEGAAPCVFVYEILS